MPAALSADCLFRLLFYVNWNACHNTSSSDLQRWTVFSNIVDNLKDQTIILSMEEL